VAGLGQAEKVRVGVGEEASGVGEAEQVAGPPEQAAGGGVGTRCGLEEGGGRRGTQRGDGAIADQHRRRRRRHGRSEELARGSASTCCCDMCILTKPNNETCKIANPSSTGPQGIEKDEEEKALHPNVQTTLVGPPALGLGSTNAAALASNETPHSATLPGLL
jgi:hypothetical protein